MTSSVPTIPGYDTLDFSGVENAFTDAAKTSEEWAAVHSHSLEMLTAFIGARDSSAILSRTAMQHMVDINIAFSESRARVEQADVEVLQALILMAPDVRKFVPTSPRNFTRFWALLSQHVFSFVGKQSGDPASDSVTDHTIRKARHHTVYYRNLFTRTDCEQTIMSLLKRLDPIAIEEVGHRFSEIFDALIRICVMVEARLKTFHSHVHRLMTTDDRLVAVDAINFFCDATPLAKRAWCFTDGKIDTLEELKWAGYQVSELACSWIYTLNRDDLLEEFGDNTVGVIDELSIRPGEITTVNPDHIYMNNPIWGRPYIALHEGHLFIPLPQLVFSFPFVIFERLFEGNRALETAYAEVRADYLEDAIADILRTAMPDAEVFKGVVWDDPLTGKTFENDVVALLGNFVFLFEAKSGRLSDSARRGADLSLIRNFKELFVEPGEQAWRLQNYLDAAGKDAEVLLKSDKSRVHLRLDTPKVVYKFSICFEHFASLTSAKHYLKMLDLIRDDTAWSPVLSLGELQLISRFLDSEISFFHYLTRRATIEEIVDFEGDEQDLLAMYLTNGLCIDPDKLEGRRIFFKDADSNVRKHKVPREDRTEFEIHGVHLSAFWTAVVKEIYENKTQRHRFDVIQVILNQDPRIMEKIGNQIRKWKRGLGVGGGDVMYTRYQIGARLFVVAVHLMKRSPGEEQWRKRARDIALNAAAKVDFTDCVVFLEVKKSKERTFDGFSFFRLGRVPKPTLV